MGLNVPDEQGLPRFTAEELALLYEREGSTIFSRSMWRSMRVINNINGTEFSAVIRTNNSVNVLAFNMMIAGEANEIATQADV